MSMHRWKNKIKSLYKNNLLRDNSNFFRDFVYKIHIDIISLCFPSVPIFKSPQNIYVSALQLVNRIN